MTEATTITTDPKSQLIIDTLLYMNCRLAAYERGERLTPEEWDAITAIGRCIVQDEEGSLVEYSHRN
jgi:hypothetical protein